MKLQTISHDGGSFVEPDYTWSKAQFLFSWQDRQKSDNAGIVLISANTIGLTGAKITKVLAGGNETVTLDAEELDVLVRAAIELKKLYPQTLTVQQFRLLEPAQR